MRDAFYSLADALSRELRGEERLLLGLAAEDSDFVRLSHNRVRQAGHVRRQRLSLELISGQRLARARVDLAGEPQRDLAELGALVATLREQLGHLPEDPHLSYATQVHNTEQGEDQPPPDSHRAVAEIMDAAEGLDLVGIWASGNIHRGFASSLGQRNWHSSVSFNLDWSCYHRGDKAVKASFAGTDWDPTTLRSRMASLRRELDWMARDPITIEPGRYRAYLAPAAVQEILEMLAWGGFGLKSRRTGQTPLIRMLTEGRRLHPEVSLSEDHTRGLVPAFTGEGFTKPVRVPLIQAGALADSLVDARSGKEYGEPVNASAETPESLAMAAGFLPRDEALAALDTGLFISRLWYLNYSDRTHARITGMTRFACFWVEDGQIRAPVNVMRFDDSVYHLLGDRLEAVTAERELILDPHTYGERSQCSFLLPGVLVGGMIFTL